MKYKLPSLSKQPYSQDYYLLLVILLTAVAMVLRIYRLGDWGFWEDELFTVSGREDGFNLTFLRQSLASVAIQSVVSMAPHGVAEWYARLVPAIVGALSVLLLYFPLKRIFDNAIALTTVALLAISPWHLYWSQNARFYTLLLLFYTLAVCYFYIGFHEGKPIYLLLATLFFVLAVKERLLAMILLPVIGAYLVCLFLFSRQKLASIRWYYIVPFILLVGLIGFFFIRPYAADFAGWMRGFGYANNSPIAVSASIAYYLGIPTILMAAAGAWYGFQQKNMAVLLFTISAAATPLLLLVISPFHYTASRYAFQSLVSWQLLAAVATVAAIRHLKPYSVALSFGIGLLLLVPSLADNFLYFQYQNGNRADWKGALTYIAAEKTEQDIVVSRYPQLADYYLGLSTSAIQNQDYANWANQDQRFWIVEDLTMVEVYPELHTWLNQNAQLVSIHDVPLQGKNFIMRVYLYEP